jgi:hypothetical protein
MMEQLSLFEEKQTKDKGRMTTTYEINWHNIIGSDKAIGDIKGYNKLSEKGKQLLKYLYVNHYKPEDGFIPAKKLAYLLGYYDTREIRLLCAEIDEETELVIYSSQYGYKIASNEREIDEAVRFALAPALTTIKRVIAKSKNESKAKMLQGYVGNMEKLYGGNVHGQMEIDENLDIRPINHFPNKTSVDYMPGINERIEYYEKNKSRE